MAAGQGAFQPVNALTGYFLIQSRVKQFPQPLRHAGALNRFDATRPLCVRLC